MSHSQKDADRSAGQVLKWTELCRAFNVREYIPTALLQKKIQEIVDGPAVDEITSVDFSGADQLTDDVCLMLASFTGFSNVHTLRMIGCVHVSDWGIKHLAKAFPHLKEVYLDACVLLTELSLFYLNNGCEKLSTVSMRGTAVTTVSSPQLKPDLNVRLEGCPLISQVTTSSNQVESNKIPKKIIILAKATFDYDLKSFLMSDPERGNEPVNPIEMNNLRYSTDVKFNGCEDTFNLFECHASTSVYSLFLSSKAIYIIMTDMRKDVNPQLTFLNKINYIRSISSHNHFILLAFHPDEMDWEVTKRLNQLGGELEGYLNRQSEAVDAAKQSQAFTDSEDGERDFVLQQHYAKMCRVHEESTNTFCILQINADTSQIKQQWPIEKSGFDEEKVKRDLEDQLTTWQSTKLASAQAKLNALNKSDLSELKSMSRPPAALKLVAEAFLVLFNEKGWEKSDSGWKRFKALLMDYRIMTKLLNYNPDDITDEMIDKLEPYVNDENFQPEKIAKVSRAGDSFSAMIIALYEYGTTIKRLMTTLKNGNEQSDAVTGVIVSLGPQRLIEMIQEAVVKQEQALSVSFYRDETILAKVMSEVKSQKDKKLVTLATLYMKVKATVNQDRRVLRKILDLLQEQGKLLYINHYGDDGATIVTDIEWFIQTVNKIYGIKFDTKSLQNKMLCKGLEPDIPLISKTTVHQLCSSLGDQELDLLFWLLCDQAILLPLPARGGFVPEPDVFIMFGHLRQPNNKMLTPEGGSRTQSFKKTVWPSIQHCPTDVEIALTYRFATGISTQLLPQLLLEYTKLGDISMAWKSGWIVRVGAVDIYFKHNIMSMLVCSELTVQARTTRFDDETDLPTIQQYLWSALSPYLAILDANIGQYQNVTSIVEIPCPGSSEIPHGFLMSTIQSAADYIHPCTTCPENQGITAEQMGLMRGRQRTLPFHDFRGGSEEDDKLGDLRLYKWLSSTQSMENSAQTWICTHCGINETAMHKLWNWECKTSPAFAGSAFTLKLGESQNLNNCLLTTEHQEGASDPDKRVLASCRQPLFLSGLQDVHITVVQSGNIKFIIAKPDYFVESYKTDESLEKPQLVLDLETGACTERVQDICDHEEMVFDNATFAEGDTLHIHVPRSRLVDNTKGTKFMLIEVEFFKNGEKFYTTNLFYRSIVGVLLTPSDDKHPSVILRAPTYPMIRAMDFPLGSTIVYRVGVASQWSVGLVTGFRHGQIQVQATQGSTETHSVLPDSADVIPVSMMMDGYTILLNKVTLKSKEQLKNYLQDNHSWPAPQGLFTLTNTLLNKTRYSSLNLHKHEPRTCTTNTNSPWVLSNQLSNAVYECNQKMQALMASYSRVYLPQVLVDSYLLQPTRQKAHSWDQQELHFVCSANSQFRDMHFMNAPASPLTAQNVQLLKYGDLESLINSYYCLLHRQEDILPHMEKVLPNVKDLAMNEVVEGIRCYLSIYLDTFLLLQRLESVRKTSRHKVEKAVLPQSNAVLSVKVNRKKQKAEATALKTDLYQQVQKHFEHTGYSVCKCETHMYVEDLQYETIQNLIQRKVDLLEYRTCLTNLSVSYTFIMESQDPDSDDKINLATIWEVLKLFPNLQFLYASNFPSLEGISQCKKLKTLRANDGEFTEIPPELESLKGTLEVFDINGCPVVTLPDFICEFSKLHTLYVNKTLISELPQNIGKLKSLKKLLAKESMISDLPESFGELLKLEHLNLNGVPWHCLKAKKNQTREVNMDYIKKNTISMFSNVSAFKKIVTTKTLEKIFAKVDVNEQKFLTGDDLDTFNMEVFKLFPRIGNETKDDDEYGGFPKALFKCRNLQILSMTCSAVTHVPDAISGLPHLRIVNLSQSPYLEDISIFLGKAPLRVLDLVSCPLLKTPPKEIVAQGKGAVIAYLKRLSQGSVKICRSKLMFVGLGAAGKTSLMRALISKDHKAPHVSGEGITDGIDISLWNPKGLTYSVWDFAGQTVYYNTHQFFMTSRAVYVLVWNTRLGYEHSGLEFWMSSIACHCPDAPVFVVGTHADQITNPDVPAASLKKRFHNIKGFYTVSSTTGDGIKAFHDILLKVTLDQPYIGEMIPEAWLNLEKSILSKRSQGSLLEWKAIKLLAQNCGIDGNELKQAIGFLHDMGTLQHFNNEFLKNRVIINPQWIVDVMACVVSVHNTVVENGHLKHSDVGKIWKNYSADLHSWMLRLTEVFDLTFPLDGQKVNIVPCLLSQVEPEYTWLDVNAEENITESKMVYKFDYLPAGLFNRLQVRLYQFSDESSLWKTGSVLEKNGHFCLVKQVRDQQLLVKSCGPRPENILLLVHEILEGLIAEFYRGVKYEYQIPCTDCVKTGTSEPAMFSSDVLRRAIDMKAYFLQCHTFFHSLSMTELQSIIPPQSGSDFEIQMQNAVRELSDLEDNMQADVFFLLCTRNVPSEDDPETVHPRKIYTHLTQHKIRCWYSEDLHAKRPEEIDLALRNVKVVLVFMSDEFVEDSSCQNMFLHITKRMKKDYVLLMVGKERNWMNSALGGMVTGKVFINFQRVHQYDDKIGELTRRLDEMLGRNQTSKELPRPDVFVSYCWVNSAQAVQMGHARQKEGSLGHGDPREIRAFLEKHKLDCWVDYERVGRMGLFHDIAVGMKQAEVVVAFISDEYVMSENCQMEFRFAHIALKKPIILCVVGTGYKWESTEIGMLALGYPKINFQVKTSTSLDDLVTSVQDVLVKARERQEKAQGGEKSVGGQQPSIKEKAFQELYELAQRKFLRQVSGYTEDLELYPRLFVPDFTDDPSEATDDEDKQENNDDAENIKVDASRPTFVVDDLKKGQFCIKLMCEHEASWHVVGEGLPISLAGEDLVQVWELAAPFITRILAILKHSSIHLHITATRHGHKLTDMLAKKAGIEYNDVIKPIYLLLRRFLMQKDQQNKRSGLKRCYLPSGKYLWLCEEHRGLPRVTVLDDETGDTEDDADTVLSPEYQLLHGLQKLANHRHKVKATQEKQDPPASSRVQSARRTIDRRNSQITDDNQATNMTVANTGVLKDKDLKHADAKSSKDAIVNGEISGAKAINGLAQVTPAGINSSGELVRPASSTKQSSQTATRPPPDSTQARSRRGTSGKARPSEAEKAQIVRKTSAMTMATLGYEGHTETSRACVIL